MPDGVRYDWVDCVCCASGKCCEYGIHAPLSFTPDEGFEIESIDVSNSGANQCVGRAVADIVLWKPGDPSMGCPSTDLGCGANCHKAWDNEGNIGPVGGGREASSALFNEWLANFDPPQGWVYNGVDNAVPNGWPFHPPCSDAAWSFWGPKSYCASPCKAGNSTARLFSYTPQDASEECHATDAARTTWMTNKFKEIRDALQAFYTAAFPVEYQRGDCQYQFKPSGPVSFWPDDDYIKCVYTKPSGDNRYCVCSLHVKDMRATKWNLKCTSSPCQMPDYNWPLTMPCSCTGEYEKPGVSASPECTLYLDTTSREWSGDRCKFIARYAGAIEAGQVACPPGTTDPNCKCCGEGQP